MQIVVKYVNFPRVGSSGKYGSIVGIDGVKIMVPTDLLAMFRAGQTVDIPTKEQVWGENPVIVATGGPGGPTGTVQGQGYQPRQPWTGSQAGAARANTGFQPRVVQGGLPSAQPAPDQGRHIFVTGTVGRAMGSGKFAASELAVLTQEACRAYDQILSPPPRPTPAPSNDPPPGLEPGDPGPELQ